MRSARCPTGAGSCTARSTSCGPSSSTGSSSAMREGRATPRAAAPTSTPSPTSCSARCPRSRRSEALMAVHCPECGFVNPEGANYCQKCGAYLAQKTEGADDASTVTYKVNEETGEYQPVDIDQEVEEAGAALVIRSGGGRAGESFTIDEERMSIGRTPDASVFLDDVTVSRNHALLVQRQDGHYIDDLGSLNGTYVNRRRIESHRLEDGDEIQIGKYKLSYLEK